MNRAMQVSKIVISAMLLTATGSMLGTASAYTVNITAGARVVYLVVGNGSFTGTLQGGGTPANNATINTVSVTVPANVIGTGAAQPMNSNSTVVASGTYAGTVTYTASMP